MTLGNVAATGSLDANAVGSIFVDGMVTGTSISLGSSDIAIGADARVGMAGVTGTLNVRNNDDSRTTYIGGTGDRDGYHLDADEMTRLFGNQEIGRAHVWTPVTNAHLVCRLLLENKKQ